MTPSQYGEGRSLDHDRMQADVLDYLLQSSVDAKMNFAQYGQDYVMKCTGTWPEFMLKNGISILGFVDIFQRWEQAEVGTSHYKAPVIYYVYEIKPKLTTVGGLVRQMQAECAAVERWHEQLRHTVGCKTRAFPVVMHDDPEIQLLRRLWRGAVLVWNPKERTLT